MCASMGECCVHVDTLKFSFAGVCPKYCFCTRNSNSQQVQLDLELQNAVKCHNTSQTPHTASTPRLVAPRAAITAARSLLRMSLTIHTELGVIRMKLRPDAAPTTAAYVSKLAQDGVYDGCTFYRSDFVIQCGLHGTGKSAPENLKINETSGEST